ncbi:unnamed protein product [Phytophthora lilii]|uniref:Unnamed protein product n=1 Tax=Phytophthora lilii TaxID=2077276 RepID=A0A9W6XP94_9STRA|nr:unnamed protein product [Phytophthora lilii]
MGELGDAFGLGLGLVGRFFVNAVFAEVSRTLPANVIAADLTVFANQAAFDAKQKLPKSSSSVNELGKDEDNALIVQVPMKEQKVEAEVTEERPGSQPHPNRLKRWADLNEVLDRNKKGKLNYDGESSTGYSYVSYNDVEKILRATSYEQP